MGIKPVFTRDREWVEDTPWNKWVNLRVCWFCWCKTWPSYIPQNRADWFFRILSRKVRTTFYQGYVWVREKSPWYQWKWYERAYHNAVRTIERLWDTCNKWEKNNQELLNALQHQVRVIAENERHMQGMQEYIAEQDKRIEQLTAKLSCQRFTDETEPH